MTVLWLKEFSQSHEEDTYFAGDQFCRTAVFGDGYEILAPDGFTQENFDALALEADAVILRTNVRVSSDVISRCRNLKIISRTGAGVDNIDLRARKKKELWSAISRL